MNALRRDGGAQDRGDEGGGEQEQDDRVLEVLPAQDEEVFGGLLGKRVGAVDARVVGDGRGVVRQARREVRAEGAREAGGVPGRA